MAYPFLLFGIKRFCFSFVSSTNQLGPIPHQQVVKGNHAISPLASSLSGPPTALLFTIGSNDYYHAVLDANQYKRKRGQEEATR